MVALFHSCRILSFLNIRSKYYNFFPFGAFCFSYKHSEGSFSLSGSDHVFDTKDTYFRIFNDKNSVHYGAFYLHCDKNDGIPYLKLGDYFFVPSKEKGTSPFYDTVAFYKGPALPSIYSIGSLGSPVSSDEFLKSVNISLVDSFFDDVIKYSSSSRVSPVRTVFFRSDTRNYFNKAGVCESFKPYSFSHYATEEILKFYFDNILDSYNSCRPRLESFFNSIDLFSSTKSSFDFSFFPIPFFWEFNYFDRFSDCCSELSYSTHSAHYLLDNSLYGRTLEDGLKSVRFFNFGSENI